MQRGRPRDPRRPPGRAGSPSTRQGGCTRARTRTRSTTGDRCDVGLPAGGGIGLVAVPAGLTCAPVFVAVPAGLACAPVFVAVPAGLTCAPGSVAVPAPVLPDALQARPRSGISIRLERTIRGRLRPARTIRGRLRLGVGIAAGSPARPPPPPPPPTMASARPRSRGTTRFHPVRSFCERRALYVGRFVLAAGAAPIAGTAVAPSPLTAAAAPGPAGPRAAAAPRSGTRGRGSRADRPRDRSAEPGAGR